MEESRPSEPALAGAARAAWPSGRLLVDYVLDVADLGRDGRPALDVLILTLVIEANLSAVNRDPALQQTYRDLDSPPPDEVRRPVSVSAVAASLGLPFETVRRRLNRLAKAGECVIGPKGVLVPTERLMAPDYVQIALARYERTRRLYHDLSAMGAVPPPSEAPPPAPPLAQGGVPVRLCNRLLSEYFLRSVEILMRAHGDPVTVLIILGLVRANLAALSPASRAAPGILPESQRIPVRRSALAQQLGMPTETVRRRLLELEQRGFCRSTPGGVLISIEAVTRPDAWELMQENYVNLSRFFGRLRRFGLLDLWDSDLRTAHAGK